MTRITTSLAPWSLYLESKWEVPWALGRGAAKDSSQLWLPLLEKRLYPWAECLSWIFYVCERRLEPYQELLAKHRNSYLKDYEHSEDAFPIA